MSLSKQSLENSSTVLLTETERTNVSTDSRNRRAASQVEQKVKMRNATVLLKRRQRKEEEEEE